MSFSFSLQGRIAGQLANVEAGRTFSCPTCGKFHVLPVNLVQGFPVDVKVPNIEYMSDGPDLYCDKHPTKPKTWYCQVRTLFLRSSHGQSLRKGQVCMGGQGNSKVNKFVTFVAIVLLGKSTLSSSSIHSEIAIKFHGCPNLCRNKAQERSN